ncbi:multicopper oxidase domain-containing protein [Spiractinospora alimapuensis]|uniref:multicopper oxidase domain-containing protein n=1 Tax=Spiractinospora alimapuensis TaxID=2820884 RepID=UPI001F18F315|nr:multicopper oxidase domain-containing protein [Spiractinospora alimapuensis]QVQ52675.1 multicopper oxidase domain-containing protein [Spiractinospora alimapuensis]
MAVDGRDLNEPDDIEEQGLRLPAGGRYDVTFTMPEGPVALLIDHDPDGGLRVRPEDAASEEMPDGVGDTRAWPDLDFFDYGEPAELPFDRDGPFDREFDMVLDRGLARVGGVPAYAQTVNGYAFPTIPTQLVDAGDLVLLTLVNRSFEPHPWHLHGHTVYVLERNGQVPSGSPIPHDTFDVLPGETWVVGFQASNPGLWMNHCHDLRHAHDGMMLRLDYTGISSPFDEEHHQGH